MSSGALFDTSPAAIATARGRFPDAFASNAVLIWRRRMVVLSILTYVIFACSWFEITFERLFGGLGKMWIVLRQMLYWKDFWSWDFAGLLEGLLQTLAMAFLGTLVAAILAVPLGFLAARNVTGAFRHIVRRFLDVLRGIDALIWALVFVRAVGLGPLAGVLAIMVSDTGTLGKLFSEAVENIDNKPMEGVRSTGAGRLQLYRFGALPQVLPIFLSQTLYLFESNVRSATILGVVGAGGIGLQLSERMRVQYWDQAAFIILMILVTVAVIDRISHRIRTRFIGATER